jgi:hypothetical protein
MDRFAAARRTPCLSRSIRVFQIALRRYQIRVTSNLHQLVIGQLPGFAEPTERLMPQIMPVEVDLTQVVIALRYQVGAGRPFDLVAMRDEVDRPPRLLGVLDKPAFVIAKHVTLGSDESPLLEKFRQPWCDWDFSSLVVLRVLPIYILHEYSTRKTNHTVIEIDPLQLDAQHLALAHSGVDRRDDPRLHMGIGSRHERFLFARLKPPLARDLKLHVERYKVATERNV